MKVNEIISVDGVKFRILKIKNDNALVVNCEKNVVPRWISVSQIETYEIVDIFDLPSIDDIEPNQRKVAYERYGLIAPVIPFISDNRERNYLISKISEEKNISKQTIKYYLWLYLVYQNVAVLAPKEKEEKTLT